MLPSGNEAAILLAVFFGDLLLQKPVTKLININAKKA
jgi:hypothetical protein